MDALNDLILARFNYWIYVILMMIGLFAMITKKNLIKKLIGMSIFQTAIILFFVSGGAVYLALFLIALAGCGLLTTVGVIVAMDTFGPVSDNAQGIAEMSGDVDAEGAQILTDLDAVGNTTKAITKGIAIATAVLAASALFGSYQTSVAEALEEAGRVSGELALAALSYSVASPQTSKRSPTSAGIMARPQSESAGNLSISVAARGRK